MSKTSFAVILCRFNDVDKPNLSMSYFTNAFAPGKGGLRDYWYNISYTKKELSGSKVFGWWKMKYSYINDGADPLKNGSQARGAWIAEAKRLAGVKGVDLSPYYGVIAVINANADDSNSGRNLPWALAEPGVSKAGSGATSVKCWPALQTRHPDHARMVAITTSAAAPRTV